MINLYNLYDSFYLFLYEIGSFTDEYENVLDKYIKENLLVAKFFYRK